jgi:hypothetical protein
MPTNCRLGVNEATYHALRKRFGSSIEILTFYGYRPESGKEFPNGYKIEFPAGIEQRVLKMVTEMNGFVPDIDKKLIIAGAYNFDARDGCDG